MGSIFANAETARTSGTDEVEFPADGVLDDVESGGVAPSEADLELVEVADEIATFDIVDSTDVDDPVLAGIAQTVRNLIYYANAGKPSMDSRFIAIPISFASWIRQGSTAGLRRAIHKHSTSTRSRMGATGYDQRYRAIAGWPGCRDRVVHRSAWTANQRSRAIPIRLQRREFVLDDR